MQKFAITLRDTRDGTTRVVVEDVIVDAGMDEDSFRFYWEDGNGACDCNRSRTMYPDDESKWLECGNELIDLVSITKQES